jgi:hypothetical protein
VKLIKTPKRGTIKRQYVKLIWDGMQTPSDVEQMRLVKEEEFEKIKADYINSIGG